MTKKLVSTLIIIVTVTTTAVGQGMHVYMWWKASEAAFSDNVDEDVLHEIAGATDFDIMIISSDLCPEHSYYVLCSYKDRNGVSQAAFHAYVNDEPRLASTGQVYCGVTLDDMGLVNQAVYLVIDEDGGIMYREEKTRFTAIFLGCKKVDWAN